MTKRAIAIVVLIMASSLGAIFYAWTPRGTTGPVASGPSAPTQAEPARHARVSGPRRGVSGAAGIPQRSWQPGLTRRYSFRAKRRLSLDAEGSRRVDLSTEASIELTPLRTTADQKHVPALVRVRGQENAAEGAQRKTLRIDVEAIASYHRDGRLHELRFGLETAAEVRRAVAAAVAALQWAAPPSPQARAWEARESHTTGEYLALYTRQTAQPDRDLVHVHKAKSHYVRLFSAHGMRPLRNDRDSVVTSDEQLAIAWHGWATHLRIRETTAVRAQPLWIQMQSEMEATLDREHEDRSALARGVLLAAQPLQSGLSGLRNAAEKRRIHDRQLARGQTTAQLLSAIAATRDADREQRLHLVTRLGAALRLDPSTTEQVVAMARGGSEGHAHVAIAALGAAGTPAAQHAIAQLIGDRRLDLPRRLSATTAVHSLTEPTDETKAALAQARASDDPELHAVATLASGTVAHKTRDQQIVGELLADLDDADNEAERVLAIDALGNAGDASALPALREAMRGADSTTRRASVAAVRFMQGEQAEAIVAIGLADPVAVVRQEALESLKHRDWTTLIDLLGATVVQDEDEDVRLTLVQLLHDRPRASEALLRQMADQDPSSRVRAAAASALSEAT